MLRRLGGIALVGATTYMVADATADALMYLKAKSLVVANAEANERFKAELGAPLAAGPWYNGSVAVSAEGHIATVTLPVRGSRRSSDVTVRVVRKGGLRSTLLYNLTGGDWEVLVMNAMIGMGPGGRPISMSLLEQEVPDMAAAAAAAAAMGHGECLPCQQQAAQQQRPAAAAGAAQQAQGS
ncbi:hypothetical protein ABPG75_002578 [Micractinium tetrahymenae]